MYIPDAWLSFANFSILFLVDVADRLRHHNGYVIHQLMSRRFLLPVHDCLGTLPDIPRFLLCVNGIRIEHFQFLPIPAFKIFFEGLA